MLTCNGLKSTNLLLRPFSVGGGVVPLRVDVVHKPHDIMADGHDTAGLAHLVGLHADVVPLLQHELHVAWLGHLLREDHVRTGGALRERVAEALTADIAAHQSDAGRP